MIPSTLNSETYVTQFEIQNEIKTNETKKKSNNSFTTVRYSELLRQENSKECKKNTEINKVVNGNPSAANVQLCGKLFTSTNVYKMETGDAKEGFNSKRKKSGLYPAHYWVLFGAMDEPDSPLDYSPDRNSFVAKVFFITFIMLAVTAGFVTVVYLSEDLRAIFLDTLLGKILFMCGMFGMMILNYAYMCSSCMRMFPCDYIALIFAVIFMSLVTAYITAAFRTTIIAYAMLATAITVLVCFLLALTSFDFTKFTIYLFVIAVAFTVLSMIVFATFAILGVYMKTLHLIILFVSTLIEVVFLIIELQAILGGKSIALGEEEHAFGAYLLYTSIVELFLKMLQIIGFFMNEGDDLF